MKLKNCCISLVLLVTTLSWGVPCANKWCGPYSIAMSGCLTGTSAGITQGSCHNTVNPNMGFYSTTTSGSHGNPFSTISAAGINGNSGSAGPDVVPNGSVGLNQFMIFANNWVQAYDKTTHKPIFVNTSGGTSPQPQPANSPWEPYLGSGSCGPETDNFDVQYDHVNSIWVIAGTSQANSSGDRFLCIASSATDDQYNSGTSYWSAYTFDVTSILPTHSSVADIADYPRFGTWSDGYYMTFDLINNGGGSNNGQIDGFAVCKLDETDISQGKASNAATCYTYIPTSAPPLIHTLLPADAESNSFQTGTAGEYFLATVNPNNGSGGPCTTFPCTSNSLAFWTWSEIVAEDAPVSVSVNTFTPGCYDPGEPGNTVCMGQGGTTNTVDSVGDRLMSRLAYRNIPIPICIACPDGEYLAATQTIRLDNTGTGSNLTGVRYYTIVTPSSTPSIMYQGNIEDSSSVNYYSMPSNAIDLNGVVGYTFTVSGPSTSSTYPSIYANTVNTAGTLGTATVVQAGSASISDVCNHHWGEYVSSSIDPSDNATFWAAGEYLSSTESTCHGINVHDGCNTADYSGCNWQTSAFTCKKGSGFCI